jgi:predicted AAA+ superfamily ATPase
MGWQTPEQMLLGPSAGAIFETHVISNLYRELQHRLKTFEIYFWRTKDQVEIDLILELDGKNFPIEIKLGNIRPSILTNPSKCGFNNPKKGLVVSLIGKNHKEIINNDWDLISPTNLINEVLR